MRPRTLRTAVLLAVTALLLAVPPASSAPAPGGSNYNWYWVAKDGAGRCDREPYGVIANLHRLDVHSKVTQDLGAMRRSGQHRLRIGIFHGSGLSTGTVMDSAGGNLSARNRRNLADLLAAVRRAGFSEFEVAFHPVGPNWVPGWSGWSEALYQENWSLIRNLRPIIRAAGIHYRIDLHNEGIPAPNQPILLDYTRRLWREYTDAFGRDDTVGFSLIGDEPARVERVPLVYGDRPPYLLDLHFYGGATGDEYASFVEAHGILARIGYGQHGWIIGEAYYNDAGAAGRLRSAMLATGRTVYYLTQWPLTRARTCADVDVAVPTAFDAYVRAGWGRLPTASWPPPAPPSATPSPTPRAAQPSPTSRPGLERRWLALDRRGRVALRLTCRRAPSPCSGRAVLKAGGRRVGTRRFRARPDVTAVRRIRVPVRLRRSVRRRGSVRGSVVISARVVGQATPTIRTVKVRLVRGRSG